MTAPQSPPEPSRLAFHPHRIVTAVGFLAVLGSMSLPFVAGSGVHRSALHLDALPTLILLLPVLALCLTPDHSRPMPGPWVHAATAVALVATTYAVVKLLDSFVLAASLGGSVGPGPWLHVAGGGATTTGLALSVFAPHTGAATGRDRAQRRTPSRLDENPFGEALFDSLEVEVPVPSVTLQGDEAAPRESADDDARSDHVIEAQRARSRDVEDGD